MPQVWSDSFSSVWGGQFAPPLAGGGLSHCLVLVWFPPPQITLQVVQADQSPQFPSKSFGGVLPRVVGFKLVKLWLVSK